MTISKRGHSLGYEEGRYNDEGLVWASFRGEVLGMGTEMDMSLWETGRRKKTGIRTRFSCPLWEIFSKNEIF